MMMEEQRDRSREDIKEMDRVKKSVESLLEQLKAEGIATDSVDEHRKTTGEETIREGPSPSKHTADDAKQVWNLLSDLGED